MRTATDNCAKCRFLEQSTRQALALGAQRHIYKSMRYSYSGNGKWSPAEHTYMGVTVERVGLSWWVQLHGQPRHCSSKAEAHALIRREGRAH